MGTGGSRRLCVLLMLVLFLVTGCERSADDIPIPTRGPVSGFTGGPGKDILYINISASTNCVDPGGPVAFTVTLENKTTDVMMLTGQPLLEIAIEPEHTAKWMPQYWSKSRDYPENLEPMVKPLEKREYHWNWKADGVYDPNLGVGNAVLATAHGAVFVAGSSEPLPLQSTVGFGVTYLKAGQVSVACHDMK